MLNIEEKISDFLKQKNLLPAGEKILLAVSGGADSVALLYIFKKLYPNAIHIAHINHQLRGADSLKDENFVKTLAKKLNLPITVESVDVKTYAKENKLSIESAARSLRLDALCRIADKENYRFIATAHHKNDNAETVIHRLLRGTGFKGLAGIRPKTIINGKTFIRPLLCLGRVELEDYLKNQNISWQNDHTNLDCRFTRNRIRHKILPYLEKETPNPVELVFSLSQHCGILAANIEQFAKAAAKSCILSGENSQVTFDLNKFLSQPQPIQVELIQIALSQLNCGLQKYTSEHYKKIIDFARTSRPGKTLNVPEKIKVKKNYDKFFIISQYQKKEEVQKEKTLKIGGKITFANWQIETEILSADKLDIKRIKNKKDNFTEWFDLERIKPPLIVRFRRTGERFKPYGLDSSKRIGKFLASAKIDSEYRKTAFLLCDSEKILWLAPIRRSNESILDISSRNILKIHLTLTS
ncbi:MAG: tRNA lysidine(34) synthetase TilS [Sedimentisphaerales bacterium]|jgi:tRNA(Ile)-lysidine synthase